MEKVRKGLAVMYLTRDGFVWFEEGNSETLPCRFSEGAAWDLEVRNKEILKTQLQSFIRSNNLLPARLIVFLSQGLLFVRQITDTRQLHREIETERFLELLPFEHLSVKEYPNDQGILVTATNKDYYEIIIAFLLEEGFVCEAIIPITAVRIRLDEDKDFDSTLAQDFLKKFDSLKQYSLLMPARERGEVSLRTTEVEHRKLFLAAGLLGSAFVLAIVILLLRW